MFSIADSPEQVCKEMQERIAQLNTLHGVELKGEMSALKKALLENPAAAALLLPEDIGAMAAAIREIVGLAIQKAEKEKSEKGSRSKAPKTLSIEELNKKLAEAGDEF